MLINVQFLENSKYLFDIALASECIYHTCIYICMAEKEKSSENTKYGKALQTLGTVSSIIYCDFMANVHSSPQILTHSRLQNLKRVKCKLHTSGSRVASAVGTGMTVMQGCFVGPRASTTVLPTNILRVTFYKKSGVRTG